MPCKCRPACGRIRHLTDSVLSVFFFSLIFSIYFFTIRLAQTVCLLAVLKCGSEAVIDSGSRAREPELRTA